MKHQTAADRPQDQVTGEKNHQVFDIWLAGGCFWGVQAFLSRLKGIVETSVGYANGQTENPTYAEVCTQNTGHAETVHVRFDPQQLPLQALLKQFFKIIDPTLRNRQGPDRGTQYRTGIYYLDDDFLPVIQQVIQTVQKQYNRPIVTEVEKMRRYDLAEDYHQDYLKKNPGGYCHIDLNLMQTADQEREAQAMIVDASRYQKPSEEELKSRLPAESYRVTRQNGTERPFTGAYWDFDQPGLYVDIVTGEPLFTSQDKFDSSCGWPSFARPIDPDVIHEKPDTSLNRVRTEVRSRVGDAHLGHVFEDGPEDRGGLRYCINSAAIRFIPLEKMAEEGYGDLIQLIQPSKEEKT